MAGRGRRGGGTAIGLDVIGGSAGSADEAMLAAAGYRLVPVPGWAVNRARQGATGGGSESEPRDARVIAGPVRIRRDRRPPIEAETGLDLDIRRLVGRRRDLGHDQTRRIGRQAARSAPSSPQGRRPPNVEAPADAAVAAAEAQTVAVPGGERVSATSSRDLATATEALAARRRIAQIDREPEAPPQAPHRWQTRP